jgi:phosphate-selective porin OprO/OprP
MESAGDGIPALENHDTGLSLFNDLTFDDAVELASAPPPSDPAPPETSYPTIKLGGFFQADVGWFDQDATSIQAVGDVQDGADFRRARLSGSGDVAENIGYFIEFDFAFPGRPSFMDVYMDIRDFLGPGTLRAGQWRQPIGMDAMTSVKELTFLERALPFAFLPFRQIGVGKFNGNEEGMGTWAISAIRFPTDVFGGNVGDDGGFGLVGRVTVVPWESFDGERLLHLGGGYTFADPSNDLVRYRNQPEFFVAETGGADLVPVGVPSAVPPFVDTGPIDTNNIHILGGEAALLLHSLYLQSEVIYASVNQISAPEARFWGAYAQAGYFLTGEVRPYNHKAGVFGRVVPEQAYGPVGGPGAWEVAARWSTIDLNDADIAGGRLNDVTLGVNWYLHRNAKLQFNYIHAFLNTPGIGDSDTDIFAGRAQVDF